MHHPFCKERKIFKESNFLKESKENRRRRYEGTSGERQPQWVYGDNVFEKCGINRDGAGEVGKPRYFNGKRHF